MAEVTGPISTLPGAHHALPDGAMCDEHPDRPAVARVQGETDSFGSELNDLCQECLDADRAYAADNPRIGVCDWCKSGGRHLRNRRDFEEGQAGRVYEVCDDCIAREQARLAEEMDELDDSDDIWPWDDDDLDDPDPDDGVRCLSCMDDPRVCAELGVCDESAEDVERELESDPFL